MLQLVYVVCIMCVMRINISIPDELLLSFDDYCKKNHYERSELIRGLIRTALSSEIESSIYGLNKQGQFQVVKESVITEGADEFGTPIKEAIAKTKKVVKENKQRKMCQHFITLGGYCRSCPGEVAQ